MSAMTWSEAMTDKPRVREGDPEARLSYFDVAQLVGTNMPEPPLHRVAQSDVEAAYYI